MNINNKSLVKKLQTAYKALEDSDFEKNRNIINTIQDEGLNHELMSEKNFLKSKNFLLQGKYEKALEVIKGHKERHPPHVKMLCEEANLFLLMSDFSSWRKKWKKIEEYLRKNHFLLEPRTVFRTRININKFLELDGYIYEALKSYKHLLKIFKGQKTEDVLLCLSQILRIESVCGTTQDINSAYFNLLEYSDIGGDHSLFIETQHALFLAELRVKKQSLAEARLFNVLKSSKIKNPTDINLFLTEFIEHCLIHDKPIDLKTIKPILKSEFLTLYEKILLNFLENKNYSLSLREVVELKNKMIFSEVLKVSVLSLRRAQNKDSLLDFVNLLLYKFSQKTRNLWRKKLDLQIPLDELYIYVHKRDGSLVFKDQKVFLKNIEVVEKVFQIFSEKTSCSMEEVIQLLYNESLSFMAIDKTRILFKRLNKRIYGLTLREESVFKVQKIKISKNQHIKLGVK